MKDLRRITLASALAASLAAAGQAPKSIVLTSPREYYVTAVSANGEWACGVYMDYSYQTYAFRWNLISDETEVLGATEPSEAYGIANDGTTVGCFTDHSYHPNGIGLSMAGYYKDGAWHLLEPTGESVTDSRAHAITPDGKYIAGYQYINKIYGGYIWKEGKLHRTLDDTRHAQPYAIHPDGQSAAGWVQRKNRTACIWDDANETVVLSDYESPWSYARQYSADGQTLLFWGGWGEDATGRAELKALYDVATGSITQIPTIVPEGGLDVFGVSNGKTVVGTEDSRGYIYADGKAQYINDYLTERGIDLSQYNIGQFAGADYYALTTVAGISADGKTLAIQYYNDDVDSDGMPIAAVQSMIVRLDQNVSLAAPVSLQAEQLDGIPAVRLTWKAPAGTSGITAYRIFRDGTELATTSATTWMDASVEVQRSYSYSVSACYGEGESERSETASITVAEPTVQPPTTVYARQKGYNSAFICWDTPRTNLISKTYYDRNDFELQGFGVNINHIDFENAIRFTAEEMRAYAGCTVRDVAFYPMDERSGWKINLYTYDAEGELVRLHSQDVEQQLDYGHRNVVKLTEPVAVPDGELIVAVEVSVPAANDRIIGIDYGQATPRFSDLLRRTDEADFYSLTEINATQGNLYEVSWLIEATLAPAGADDDIDVVKEYAVEADGQTVARTTHCSFTIPELAEGEHRVGVSTVYADGRTSPSSTLDIHIRLQAEKLPAIMDVKAEPAGETGVRLTWEAPREADPTTITYASGEIKDKGVVGPPENNYGVIAGVLFKPEMLKSYGGYLIKSVSFVPMADASFSIFLLEDNVRVAEINVDDYTLGAWNTFELTTPVVVKEASNYLLAIDCYDVTPNGHAIAVDDGPEVQFYSDLYSLDGSTWSSIGTDASIFGNWMMTMNLEDAAPAPLAVKGYDVEIDQEKRNEALLTKEEFDFNFPAADKELHSASVSVHYADAEKPVKGGLCEFYLQAAGIQAATADDAELHLSPGENFLNVPEAERLEIIAADGSRIAAADGCRLQIPHLQPGVYILTATVRGKKAERKVSITR